MGAIRLFLALAVVQSHLHYLEPGNIYLNHSLLGVSGGHAVMLFFVVSGFLISYVLEKKYDHEGGTREFYYARARRIYPLWWVLYLLAPLIVLDGLWTFVTHRHAYDVLVGFLLFGYDWLAGFWTYPNIYVAPVPHGLDSAGRSLLK